MTASLDDLRTHARRTYRYWPIYLMLRLREIEQHLDPAAREPVLPASTPSPDLVALVAAGLWSGTIPANWVAPPALTVAADALLTFDVVTDETAVLVAVAVSEDQTDRLDLLRTPPAYHEPLVAAAAHFTRLATDNADHALALARLWSTLHGARALNWRTTASTAPPSATTAPPLPHRRRSKGLFRVPH